MEKYEKYRVHTPQTASIRKYEKYRIFPAEQEGDSWAALIGKSALKGVSSIADIPIHLAEYMANASSKGRDMEMQNLFPEDENFIPTPEINLPKTSDIRSDIKRYTGVDLEPHPATPGQRIASNAAEFAGGFLVPGGAIKAAAKAPGLFSKFAKTSKTLAPATAIGGTSGVLQEGGVDPLIADLGTSVTMPLGGGLTKFAKHLGEKGLLKLGGLSGKNFKLDTAKAAKKLGVDLPPAALTDSPWAALAHQYSSKMPVLNNYYKRAYDLPEEQMIAKINQLYNKVGPKDTAETRKNISRLYEEKDKLLPEGAQIFPNSTLENTDLIKRRIQESLRPSDAERKVYNIVNELESNIAPSTQYGRIKAPVPVKGLTATKRSFNDTIDFDPEVRGVRNYLKKPLKGINEDIAEYGKTNPEWYNSYKEADELFAKTARRKDLENRFKNVVTHEDKLSYPALSKVANSPENQNRLKQLAGNQENIEAIQNLGEIAKRMSTHNKSAPNPSGTAVVGAVGAFLYNLAVNPIATLGGSTAFVAGGGSLMTKLGTDKRFVDLAIKHAENPNNEAIAKALNAHIKKVTGYSVYALNKELSKSSQEERMANGL